jgi:2-isopropylmalate synthase
MIPGTERSLFAFVQKLKKSFEKRGVSPKIAVHCHNDRGLALANALDGYRAGANIIDATVLGLGERAGLVDLAALLVVLKADFQEKNEWKLEKLVELYQLVQRYSGISIPVNYPVTGENAFTHCAGLHTQAATVDPVHYESLSPDYIGRKRHIALDHMSGLSSIRYALEEIGVNDVDESMMLQILEKVKTVGKRGKTIDLNELQYIINWCKEKRTLK